MAFELIFQMVGAGSGINTSAELTLRFEADDEESLHKCRFSLEIRAVDNTIHINWDQ